MPPTYPHWLRGPCRCGVTHGGSSGEVRSPTRASAAVTDVAAGKPVSPQRVRSRVPGMPTVPASLQGTPRDDSPRTKVVRHEVAHVDGLVFLHCREVDATTGKKVRGPWWQQSDGTRRLPEGISPKDMLFGLERLRELPDGAEMIIAEGEPAARALHWCGLHAVGTVCGSGTVPSDAVLYELIRFKCVLWPDADRDGDTHMGRIASRLVALGCPSVERIEWSEAPPKGDAADLIRPFTIPRDLEGARAAVEALPRRQWSPVQAGHDHEETLGCGG
jgi:hypothetical protein